MTEHTHFDFAKLNERERYKILIGTVIPRPIALVTTVSKNGLPNAGPFSFFNVLTHDPAIVAIGVENYSDMRFKDTARNIRETGEFTVHICDNALVDQMEVCAIKFGPRGGRDGGSRSCDRSRPDGAQPPHSGSARGSGMPPPHDPSGWSGPRDHSG